jgi:hypothetical protein
MKKDDNYSILADYSEMTALVNSVIGEGVSPTNEELGKLFEVRVKGLGPRSFAYIMDVKTSKSFRSKGLRLLGLKDRTVVISADLIGAVHENQRLMVSYQSLRLHELFATRPELITHPDSTYTTTRGIKLDDGSYRLCHQQAQIVQVDSQGYPTKYYSSYRITSPYKGEPFITEAFAPNEAHQRELDEAIELVKKKMPFVLGFSDAEEVVIREMAVSMKLTSVQIGDKLGLSGRTIEIHRRNILRKGREAFPLNNFEKAIHVIVYLKAQQII